MTDHRAHLRRDMMQAADAARDVVGYALVVLYRTSDDREEWHRWDSCDDRWKLIGAEYASLVGNEVLRLANESGGD